MKNQKAEKLTRAPSSIEEAWLWTDLHLSASEDVMKLLLDTAPGSWRLDTPIQTQYGANTTLLKEWLSRGLLWPNLMKKWSESQKIADEVIWDAVKNAMVEGSLDAHATLEDKNGLIDNKEDLWLMWLKKIKNSWCNDDSKKRIIITDAINRNMLAITNEILNSGFEINGEIKRDVHSHWKHGTSFLGAASSKDMISLLIKHGGNPFQMISGEVRAWDEWVGRDSSAEQKEFARNMSAATMLPESQTPAKDVLNAYETCKTVLEKSKFIRVAAKNGFWNMRGINGRTTLMGLILRGALQEKTVYNTIPKEEWSKVDENGRSVDEYIWARWRSTNEPKPAESIMSMTGEKIASFIFEGLTRGKQYFEYTPMEDYEPIGAFFPKSPTARNNVCEISKEVESDFWKSFINKDGAVNAFITAVFANFGTYYGSSQAATMVKGHADCYEWNKSLETTTIDGKHLWEIDPKWAIAGAALIWQALNWDIDRNPKKIENGAEMGLYADAMSRWMSRGATIAGADEVFSSLKKYVKKAFVTTESFLENKGETNVVYSFNSSSVVDGFARWVEYDEAHPQIRQIWERLEERKKLIEGFGSAAMSKEIKTKAL